jgi:hypothetical protein
VVNEFVAEIDRLGNGRPPKSRFHREDRDAALKLRWRLAERANG